MSVLTDAINYAWRSATNAAAPISPGNPANPPNKTDILNALVPLATTVDTTSATVATLQNVQQNGVSSFANLAALNANLNYAAGSVARVVFDATPANNGYYVKSGASGAGSWAFQSVDALSNPASFVAFQTTTNTSITALQAGQTTTTNAITSEVTSRANADTAEATVRLASDVAEGNTRSAADTALSAAITAEASSRATADSTLTTNLTNEATYRVSGDAAVQAGLIAETANRIQAFNLANIGLASEATSRIAADTALSATVIAQGAANNATLDSRRFEHLQPFNRPGDNPFAFTQVLSPASLGGAPELLPIVPPATVVVNAAGLEVLLTGSGVIGGRRRTAIEPGRLYRVRWSAARRSNPSDPLGDAVQYAIAWFSQSLGYLATTTASAGGFAPVVSDGVQTLIKTIATAAGGTVDIVTPSSSDIYAVAYVQTYGLDGVTAVIACGIDDITSGVTLDAVSTSVTNRVTTLESFNAGSRLTTVEAQLSGATSATYATKSDATSATIPATVTTVQLRGGVTAGDGNAGVYVKIAGSLPANADGFTSGGVAYLRVVEAQRGPSVVFLNQADFLAASAAATFNTPAPFGVAQFIYLLNPDLWYKKGGSTPALDRYSLVIYGQVLVLGIYWIPVYSTKPVKIAQFFPPSGATFSRAACLISGTANGTTLITAISISGYAPTVGMKASSINWATLGAAALASGATVTAYSAGTSITLSAALAAGPVKIVVWDDTITGVDAQPAWQAAINYGLINGLNDFEEPTGAFRFDNTLQCGYGDTFSAVRLDGMKRSNDAGIGGCYIYFTPTDRPCINFQGARSGLFRGASVYGRNYNYAQWGQGFSNSMSANDADWLAPHYTPVGSASGGLQRYAPFAGITTDAVAGATPATPYLASAFPPPPWAPALTLYGRSLSSEVTVDDVVISGFAAARVISPNQDQQNDYMRFTNFLSEACIYIDCIGPSQSRNIWTVNGNIARYHTFQSNRKFGSQTGTMGGLTSNITGGNAYQLFDFSTAYYGGHIVQTIYTENGKRLGRILGGSGSACNFTIAGGNLALAEFSHGEIVESYIQTDTNATIVATNLTIQGGYRIVPLVNAQCHLVIDGGFYFGGYGTVTSLGLTRARGFVGGAIYMGRAKYSGNNRPTFQLRGFVSVFDDNGYAKIVSETVDFAGPRELMTQFYNCMIDEQGRKSRFAMIPPSQLNIFDGGYYTSGTLSQTNDIVTFTYLAGLQTGPDPGRHINVGNILDHIPTNTLLVVESVGAPGPDYLITCRQSNRMNVDANGVFVKNNNPVPAFTGGTLNIRTNAVLPRRMHYGSFTAGSTAVTGISKGDGVATDLTTYLQNGDEFLGLLWPNTPYLPCPIPAFATLSAVTNGSPGTLTLSAPATTTGVFPLYPFPVLPC